MAEHRNSSWDGNHAYDVQPLGPEASTAAPMLNGEVMPSSEPSPARGTDSLDSSSDTSLTGTYPSPDAAARPDRSSKIAVVAVIVTIVGLVLAFAARSDDGVDALDSEPVAEAAEDVAGDLGELTVTETSVLDEGDFWTYFATVENGNSETMWSSVAFTAEAYDADGVLLDSSLALAGVMPGQSVALAGAFFDVGETEIESLEILIDGQESAVESESVGTLELTEPQVANDEYQSVVSGNVTSSFGEDREYVTVIAVVRDAAGTVIDIDQDMIERVAAGGEARYQVTLWGFTVEDSMTVEVYARP